MNPGITRFLFKATPAALALATTVLLILPACRLNSTSQKNKAEKTFTRHCTPCHLADAELLGPPLANILDKREETWLIKFISDSKSLKNTGDPIAARLEAGNNFDYEHRFSMLSRGDIRALLQFLQRR